MDCLQASFVEMFDTLVSLKSQISNGFDTVAQPSKSDSRAEAANIEDAQPGGS